MNWEEFKTEVLSGQKTDYVDDRFLEFLEKNAEFRIIKRSAMDKSGFRQSELVNISTPYSTDELSDAEILSNVRETILEGNLDTQKYQLRDQGGVCDTVEVWRHPNGYSAFALNEN